MFEKSANMLFAQELQYRVQHKQISIIVFSSKYFLILLYFSSV